MHKLASSNLFQYAHILAINRKLKLHPFKQN